MPKRVIGTCHFCGRCIFDQESQKVMTDARGIRHYHYDKFKDCLKEERELIAKMHRIEDSEIDYVVGRGDE